MGRSRAERLAQMRATAKKRRQKIQHDPQLREAENQRRRQKYAKDESKRLKKKSKMSERAKRSQRKRWSQYKREYREKSNADRGPLEHESHQKKTGKRRRRRNLAACYYRIRTLRAEVANLKKTVIRYKVRLCLVQAAAVMTDSPRNILKKQLRKNTAIKVDSHVKRQLLFGSALATDVRDGLSKVSSRKLRRDFRKQLSFKFLTKYRFMSLAKPFFPVKLYEDRRKRIGGRKIIYEAVAKKVRKFYEQDDVSTQSPGKKDYITRNKIQKQKRYLQNSLKYLHKKFCEDSEFVISYTSFCRLKPFWVVSKHVSERDTCLCKKCENITLIHNALKKVNLFSHDLPTVIKNICCDPASEHCYFRKCPTCEDKIINFDTDNDTFPEDIVPYDIWEKIEEKGEDGKRYARTVKVRKEETVTEICDLFLNLQIEYMAHVGRIRHQYRALKDMKNASREDSSTVIIHCDFSENYSCKYGREIQSCHFGANRKQITLHTGMLYNGDKHSAFCSVSQCLQHDSVAIWCHLQPIITDYALITKKIHFISDSPSSQYRNKGMFKVMFAKIIALFPNLLEFTWNYLESGHGKGAADGVGGVLKRTCDRVVAHDEDIASFQQFFSCVQKNIPKVHLVPAIDRDSGLEASVASAIAVQGKTSLLKVIEVAKTKVILYSLSSLFFRHHVSSSSTLER